MMSNWRAEDRPWLQSGFDRAAPVRPVAVEVLHNRSLAAVNSVALSLDQFENVESMLVYALDQVLEAVGTEAGSVYLLDDAHGELTLVVAKGLPPDVFDDFDHLKLGEGLSGQVALTGQPMLLDNLADDARLTRMKARVEQLRGFASVPLKTRDRIYGTLNVHTHDRRQFSVDDVNVLTSIGVQIGYAIGNARLYHDLQASEQRFRSLVESARDLIFQLDAAGRIVYINPVVESLLGYTPDEICDSSAQGLHFVHPDDRQNVTAKFRGMVDGEEFSALQFRVITKDGQHVRWLSLSGYPLLTNGVVMGVQAIARDVTERRRLQERVARAERLAEVGRLAAGIAHEVRNPLGAILNAATLLRRDASPHMSTDDQRLLSVMIEEAKRLSSVVGDVLAFARPPEPQLKACDVHQLLSDIVQSFCCDEVLGRRVSIDIVVAPGLPLLEADPNQLRQVIWNVLKNAAEASRDGTRVKVIAEPVSGSTRHMRIEVVDEGCGIGTEMLARLFEPFATNKADGTGLGLAVVHRIVEAHGGTTHVESRQGFGTRLTIDLPITH